MRKAAAGLYTPSCVVVCFKVCSPVSCGARLPPPQGDANRPAVKSLLWRHLRKLDKNVTGGRQQGRDKTFQDVQTSVTLRQDPFYAFNSPGRMRRHKRGTSLQRQKKRTNNRIIIMFMVMLIVVVVFLIVGGGCRIGVSSRKIPAGARR